MRVVLDSYIVRETVDLLCLEERILVYGCKDIFWMLSLLSSSTLSYRPRLSSRDEDFILEILSLPKKTRIRNDLRELYRLLFIPCGHNFRSAIKEFYLATRGFSQSHFNLPLEIGDGLQRYPHI